MCCTLTVNLSRSENSHSIDEMKERWQDFCQKLQLYGVWKKMLTPKLGMDKAEQAIRILRVLPSLFPSPSAPPKQLRDASEALRHVLEAHGDSLEEAMKGMQVGLLIGYEGERDAFPQQIFNVAVVVEETIVLHNLKDVACGSAMLLGLIINTPDYDVLYLTCIDIPETYIFMCSRKANFTAAHAYSYYVTSRTLPLSFLRCMNITVRPGEVLHEESNQGKEVDIKERKRQ
ncbi:hypothetical protein KUCAC02_016518, partial [Chaenocephalus aceratus]